MTKKKWVLLGGRNGHCGLTLENFALTSFKLQFLTWRRTLPSLMFWSTAFWTTWSQWPGSGQTSRSFICSHTLSIPSRALVRRHWCLLKGLSHIMESLDKPQSIRITSAQAVTLQTHATMSGYCVHCYQVRLFTTRNSGRTLEPVQKSSGCSRRNRTSKRCLVSIPSGIRKTRLRWPVSFQCAPNFDRRLTPSLSQSNRTPKMAKRFWFLKISETLGVIWRFGVHSWVSLSPKRPRQKLGILWWCVFIIFSRVAWVVLTWFHSGRSFVKKTQQSAKW